MVEKTVNVILIVSLWQIVNLWQKRKFCFNQFMVEKKDISCYSQFVMEKNDSSCYDAVSL